MSKFTLLLSTLLLGISAISDGEAQEIENLLSVYSGENGENYARPLLESFTSALHTNIFSTSLGSLDQGFHIGISATASIGFVSDAKRLIEVFSDIEGNDIDVPSIFGSPESITITDDDGLVETYPGGFNVDIVPMVVPQIQISNIAGTEMVIRYFGAKVNDDFGSVKLLGIGLRHNLAYHKIAPEYDAMIGIAYHQVEVGKSVTGNSFLGSFSWGKSTEKFSYYGIMAYQIGNYEVEYINNSDVIPVEIKLDIGTKNSFMLGAGAGVLVGPFRANAELSYSAELLFSLNLGFRI